MRTESDTPCVEEKAGRAWGRGRGQNSTLCGPHKSPQARDTVHTCFLTPCLSWASKDAPTPEVELSLQVGPDAWMAPLDKSYSKTNVPVLIALNRSPRGGQSHVSLDHRLPRQRWQQWVPLSSLSSSTHKASWLHNGCWDPLSHG